LIKTHRARQAGTAFAAGNPGRRLRAAAQDLKKREPGMIAG